MKLSIIIVNWNSREHVRKCLESLDNDPFLPESQIIVVDGGSFDGCDTMVASEFPMVEFVQSRENIGFGRCNNLGFEQATSDAVLLLNPDTEVLPGSIERMLQTLEQHPDAGIVGARLLNADGSVQEAGIHRLPRPLGVALDCNVLRRWRRKRMLRATHHDPVRVEAVSGACMLMRSGVFRSLGGFDPAYFMYAEDMDLCMRVHRAGLHVYHDPGAEVIHHGGGSSNACPGKFQTVMIREAVDTYMRIHHGPVVAWMCRLCVGISAILRLALLAPAWFVALGETRRKIRHSIAKWWVVLRWLAGRESWASPYFRNPMRGEAVQRAMATATSHA